VGEGNVGKTSLVAALLRGRDGFIENRDTTHGIETQELRAEHPKLHVEIVLHTWDFGGQEVYRITNQFFFSARSLYLVVWKPREGREENAIEAWLRRIRLRALDARVIIVATHWPGEGLPDLDYAYLQSQFGDMLADVWLLSTTTRRDQVEAMISITF